MSSEDEKISVELTMEEITLILYACLSHKMFKEEKGFFVSDKDDSIRIKFLNMVVKSQLTEIEKVMQKPDGFFGNII